MECEIRSMLLTETFCTRVSQLLVPALFPHLLHDPLMRRHVRGIGGAFLLPHPALRCHDAHGDASQASPAGHHRRRPARKRLRERILDSVIMVSFSMEIWWIDADIQMVEREKREGGGHSSPVTSVYRY